MLINVWYMIFVLWVTQILSLVDSQGSSLGIVIALTLITTIEWVADLLTRKKEQPKT